MENFANFNKPIGECTDEQLINWYIAFLNGADWEDKYNQMLYEIFKAEVPNRSIDFQNKIEKIDSII